MKHWLILYIILSFFATKVAGMRASTPTHYHNISTFNGLPSNTVGAIKKDASGFIWIGTKLGLCRFDGCEIKTYPILSGEDIWSIEELDADTLLIGTVNSLKYFSRKSNAVIQAKIPTTIVKAIKKIDHSRFLAGTETGLYLIENHIPRKILLETGLSSCNHITSIICETPDIYWFSTADGLGRIDLSTMKTSIYRTESDLAFSNNFICLTCIGNSIYLGSFNKGIFCFNTTNGKFMKIDGFEHNLIMTIDGQGEELFVGTNGKGLKILSLADKSIEVVSYKEKSKSPINSNTITAFLYDNGIRWIGTQFGGISYTPPIETKFSYYNIGDFNSTDYRVRSFYMFPNGNKLIGTRTGLFFVSEEKNAIQRYSTEIHSPNLRSDIILFIHQIGGKILIATYGGGVNVFDEQTLKLSNLSQEEPFLYGCFFHFAQDKKGNLWLASQNGLYQSTPDGKILRKYDTMNSPLKTNTIFYVYPDSMDRLWIGTKFGLFLMDINTGNIRSDCFSTPINSEVKYIMEDSRKDIWICSNSGLYKIGQDLVITQHYTTENLLPDNQILSIQEDKQGIYWIATGKEIVRYNPAENTQYTYQRMDGLSDLDFNNDVIISADSTIWWANEGGLIYTSKENAYTHRKLTEIPTITSYYIADKEYDFPYMEQSKEVNLPTSENNIRFKFSNMTYALPYANLYEYKLDGYDANWTRQTGLNEVEYKNLPSGHYIFKLRIPGGEEEGEQIAIHVRKSYAAVAGAFLMITIISLLVIYFSYKIWKLKKRMIDERAILSSVQEQGKNKKTALADEKINNRLDVLLTYMDREKPYLNAKLNIGDISEKLDCTETDLSQLLNNHMNVNFANFINVYRVNEIKSRLNQENLSKYTLKALSEQCGFSSKTTFYRVFKNVTGMTPLEYCKKQKLIIVEN